MRSTLLALAIAAGIAVPLQATTVEIKIRVEGRTSTKALVVATPVISSNTLQAKQVELAVPGSSSISLAPAVWRFVVQGDGLFHPGVSFDVKGDAMTIDLTAWEMRSVNGAIAAGSGKLPAPLNITAHWTASREVTGVPPVPEGEAPCELREREFRCEVPRAALDLRIRPRGFVSAFFWGVRADQNATPPLLEVTLKRGGVIVGYVTAAKGVKLDARQTRVAAFAQSAATHTATIDRRGFFMIEGVEPGSYRISATSGAGIASEERLVDLKPGLETELLRPLILEKLVPLRITVQPALIPEIGPWQVSVERRRSSVTTDRIASAPVRSGTGEVELGTLPPGSYVVRVASSSHEGDYARREIRLPDDANAIINVDVTHVEGTVTLGEKPIAAQIRIGGRNRSPAVQTRSNDAGHFAAFAPAMPETSWLISVDAVSPRISADLNVAPVAIENGVRLDIHLSAGTIEGVVTEAVNGAPARAHVNVYRIDTDDPATGIAQVSSSATDGKFSLTGLQPGKYEVQAEGSDGRTTDRVEVTISEDAIADVKLTLGPDTRLKGRVLTDGGAPVAGAIVYVIPFETPPLLWLPRTTSAAGDFEVALPATTKSAMVAVIAGGFAFKAFRVPVEFERQLNIAVRQNGGALEIEGAASATGAKLPMVVHNGIALPLMFFLTSRIGTTNGPVATLPLVEPGDYAICAAPRDAELSYGAQPHALEECAAGVLPPFGILRLRLPSRSGE
ncbi:MAG: hypothetical protein QOI24_2469 [Acidobacteriota bacterium]|jgi:hypothetical protein|nr:hypothetical protein [Acidobacteriota bacterium]